MYCHINIKHYANSNYILLLKVCEKVELGIHIVYSLVLLHIYVYTNEKTIIFMFNYSNCYFVMQQ